jgi:hypothetical protein
MERKLAQDLKDFEANDVQGSSMLHLRREMRILKRRLDLRKETLLGVQEWRNEYLW